MSGLGDVGRGWGTRVRSGDRALWLGTECPGWEEADAVDTVTHGLGDKVLRPRASQGVRGRWGQGGGAGDMVVGPGRGWR